MPSQIESTNSAAKRKASNEQDKTATPGSPASKRLKASPTSTSDPTTKDTPTNIKGSANSKPKSATAAALSSIPKAKRAPGGQPPAKKQSRRTPPRREDAPPTIARSPSRSPPRQRKRPGQAGRVGQQDVAAMRKRQAERAAERQAQRGEANMSGNVSFVREAYNAVPERGREWRSTESKIKGLRNFNNWVKAVVIQKFSSTEDPHPGSRLHGYTTRGGLRVLDMGCGKGGDLQKWHNTPSQVDLYIGLDPADMSINDARRRYDGMGPKSRGRPLFNAHFITKDCFQAWLGEVQTVRQVGIDPNPGQGMTMPNSGGGFDVVAMMFSLHYAFETERQARTMLRNVAGALKKGGRFLGVIPNSDVIQAKLKESWKKRKREQEGREETPKPPPREDGEIDEEAAADDSDVWDPEKMLDALPTIDDPSSLSGENTPNGFLSTRSPLTNNGYLTPHSTHSSSPLPPYSTTPESQPSEVWGNALYQVDFISPPPPPSYLFRPKPFGWKYIFKLTEAVGSVPEYVVPWEALRSLASEFDLELRYLRTFEQVWEEERDDETLGPLSQRMGVRDERGGRVMGEEEMEAARFYSAFCFYKA